jgi:8-amino-3,8-dideoxy-alpha-D-manno-octulosonate transaminase
VSAPRPLLDTALAAVDRLKPLERHARRWVLPDLPRRLEIETSSRCNRACYYCPVSVDPRDDQKMPEALLFDIVEQAAAMGFRGVFSPHFYGEPLLDPRLPALIAGVHKRLPKAAIQVFSNGDPLTPKKARDLLDAGVGLFLVTLEGDEPKALRDTRASLSRWTWRRHFLVRRFDQHVPKPFNRGGSVLFPGRETHLDHCLHPALALVIDAWGKVKICANDYYGQQDLGDLRTERLVDVWNRPANKALRYALMEGRFERPLCRVCTGRDAAPAPLRVNA